MKSNIKLLMLTGALMGMSACTNLDTDIKSQYTTYPDHEAALFAKFDACYYYLRNEAGLGRNFWEGVMMQGDEMMGVCYTASNYFDNGRVVRPSLHDLTLDIPGVGLMDNMMQGVTYCNTVISELGGEDGKNAVVAPIRAIRAFYTYMMIDLYGDAPLLDKTPAAGTVIERKSRPEVAKWIESELKEVIPQLTTDNDLTTYGRPNKWMAEALLVKLYLNWGVYMQEDVKNVTVDSPNERLDDCIAWCDSLIDSQEFSVGQGYRKKFFPNNTTLALNGEIKDFIYVMPFDPNTLGQSYSGGHTLDRFMNFKKANKTTPGPWGFQPAKSTAGIYVLTNECAARFNLAGDERNEMILKGPQYAMDYTWDYAVTETPLMLNGTQVEYTPITESSFEDKDILSVGADGVENCQKGYRLAKYVSDPSDYSVYGRYQSNDIPIFRYADILLTKAECLVRKGESNATAAALINEVRDCSGAEHFTGTVTLQDILDERGREFICEMWRRQDLIRCGQFENDWGLKNIVNKSAKTDKWRRLMPIPRGVLETNTNWKQNEGYSGIGTN